MPFISLVLKKLFNFSEPPHFCGDLNIWEVFLFPLLNSEIKVFSNLFRKREIGSGNVILKN